ncbi:MAG TPA: GxxExxY protein [Flavobacteriales bacterium]
MPNRDPDTFAIIGAAMEVHSVLGHGFLENVYQEALCRELVNRRVPFVTQVSIPIFYKGERLVCSYRADLVCWDSIVVELKAIRTLSSADQAQVMNYLKGTGLRRGLLLNFGNSRLQYERLVWGYSE